MCYDRTSLMERWKRLIYYLLINIVISACTILAVLTIWERVNQPELIAPPVVTEVISSPTVQVEAPAEEAAAVATQVQAPQPSPTLDDSEFESYTVRPGDTLGGIADQFGVTVEEIVEANNLENPDVLDVDDVLLIPIPPDPNALSPTDAPAPTNTLLAPTLLPEGTSTPLPPGFDPQLEIVTVVAAGNLADERVVIRLNGDAELALHGWSLQDEDGNVYVFPELILFKDGAVTVYTKSGANNVVELFWGLGESVWESGETVLLADPQGNEQATYMIP